ncbi:MAG: HD domain-containing protein [Candidatus Eisenbacteria bacterium]
MEEWEARFQRFLVACYADDGEDDSSHGVEHVRRVVRAAKQLAEIEGARFDVVVPAAWLHDCVLVEKSSPDRPRASSLAADRARGFLIESGYSEECVPGIHHAIRAHSFSAGIPPETKEAQVVQDADRLDALGAIGLARCLMVGERMGRPLYDAEDPFCENRTPDDSRSAIDHFYTKLLTLPGTMQTEAGRREAERRASFLRMYLTQLESELGGL